MWMGNEIVAQVNLFIKYNHWKFLTDDDDGDGDAHYP